MHAEMTASALSSTLSLDGTDAYIYTVLVASAHLVRLSVSVIDSTKVLTLMMELLDSITQY